MKTGNKKILIFLWICVIGLHLGVSTYDMSNGRISGDIMFSFTLSNSPYDYDFIDHMFKYMPNENGWIDSTVLRQDYMVGNYNRFNFSQVYWHQRIDFHPLLYYSLVHFVCSLFPNTFSIMYAAAVNVLFLLFIDLLFIAYSKKIWKTSIYALPMVAMLALMTLFRQASVINFRPYAGFSALALWYIYIHHCVIAEGGWSKKRLIEMMICIVLGTQIHYYYYVFGGLVSLYEVFSLVIKKKYYSAINYCYCGFMGIMITMIVFPWMLWATVITGAAEHENLVPWSVSKVLSYLDYMNKAVFNGRFIAFLMVILVFVLTSWLTRRKAKDNVNWNVSTNEFLLYNGGIFFTFIVYSLFVFYLDQTVPTYIAPTYIMGVIVSMWILKICSEKIISSRPLQVFICLCAVVIIEGLSILDCMKLTEEEHDEYMAWHNVAVEHSDCAAIYVYNNPDNLLNNNWIELSQSKKFKIISYEDYLKNAISANDLKGRGTEGNVLLYVPSSCEISVEPDLNAEQLASFNKVTMYILSEK